MSDRLSELIEENQKLRAIEEQFWILLQEHETLSQRAQASPPQPLAADAVRCDVAPSKENERLAEALREALELLLARERGESIEFSRGPVASFLSWCEIEHVKAEVEASATDRPPQQNPRINDQGLAQEVSALRGKVHDLERENRDLQDELDRVDLSRIQALEDADRMQRQVAALSESILDIRSALNAEQARAEKHAHEAAQVPQLRARIADQDGIIAELTAESDRLRNAEREAGSDLAADAARIREELQKRQSGA
jgi:hypothetical protein